jgi:hypothetical protein
MSAPANDHKTTRFRRSESVAHRRIEDEVLLIPIRSDAKQGLAVFSLNPTAALLWDLLDGVRTIGELAGALCEKFEVAPDEAHRDVQSFCADLLECGAIEPVPESSSESP